MMLDTTRVSVTQHALLRYRERLGRPTATEADVERAVRASEPMGRGHRAALGRFLRRKFTPEPARQRLRRRTVLVGLRRAVDRAVFVCSFDRPGEMAVVTCFAAAEVLARQDEPLPKDSQR